MTLQVGHITYANCAPYFHYLADCGFTGDAIGGVPSDLNRMLSTGQIDVCPSSSFEYARNWRDYLLLPDHSISSCGPVKSVLLFSPCPIEELKGQKIALTGESATSINLLQVLLLEYYGFSEVKCAVPDTPIEEVVSQGGAALIIGDRALKTAMNPAGSSHIYDLGELWQQHTGLPFVFALWILRRNAAEAKSAEVRSLVDQLGQSRCRAFASLETLAKHSQEKAWMSEAALVDYWQCMSYDLGPAHLDGLKLFFSLCHKHGRLEEMPEIHFF